MTNEYRDPLAGIRSQIVYKRSAIDALFAELTPIRRLVLNPDALADIDEQRAGVVVEGADLAALSECLRRAEALEILLARAVERAKVQATLPDHLTPLGAPPWQLSLPFRRLDMSAIVGKLVAPYGAAEIDRWGTAGAARFEREGHPLRVVAHGTVVHGLLRPRIISVDVALMTSVPAAIPDLAARVEYASDSIISRSLSRSLKTGDHAFDETFFTSGDEGALKVLFSERVRNALVTLSQHEARVRIGGGLAEIGWTVRMSYDAIAPLPKAAIDFIVALRSAIASG